MATMITCTSEVDHIVASETYRLSTFDSLSNFPLTTRRQLALSGFIYRDNECICPQCGIRIELNKIDENTEYKPNYFRQLHRKQTTFIGKRCSFLLCESGTNIDDLHVPPSSQQQSQWENAEIPEFISYSTRLQSFDSWPYLQELNNETKKTFVTPLTMAKHGFYFSGPIDGVTCFYCGNTLVNWSSAIKSTNENIVQLEHARFFPCRFVINTAGVKFVASAGYFHTVSDQERRVRNPMLSEVEHTTTENDVVPKTLDECLATFETWPSNAPLSPNALADTGFYYLGEELRVKCFMCGLEVNDWQHGMTALGTHRKRQPDCDVLRAMDSVKSKDIQVANEKWRLETLNGLSFAQIDTNSTQQSETDKRLCRELAACGFFRYRNTKVIRCAFCGITIEPDPTRSIMSQHRYLTKQKDRKIVGGNHRETTLDCLIVRAQCPTNIVIPHREPFPEYPKYRSMFDRIKTFDNHKGRYKRSDSLIRDMAEAGFFLDEHRHLRCFQCGNALPVNDKTRREKYPQHTVAQLHAHFYPTCEWVKEILGAKYIAQVLHDRNKSIDPPTPSTYHPQASSSSSTSSLSSSTAASAVDSTVTANSNKFDEPFISDHSGDSSDDENFQTVIAPSNSFRLNSITSVRSPLSFVPSCALTTTGKATTCVDSTMINTTSPLIATEVLRQINPFQQLAAQQEEKQLRSERVSSGSSSQELSPSIEASASASSPTYVMSSIAHEINRLETFKQHDRITFGHVDVGHLAYVGFYLNAEGLAIQCPWCDVKLTEREFEEILRTQPSVARSALSDEPWTPMRVHRHANGILMDTTHTWCQWVRREVGGLYPNVPMLESHMRYPEYPSYASVEKRVKSFTSDWVYPSGSRLSNQIMAEAGFVHLGGDSVCCFYCGNKLQKFEPRDCPFEEHATFYPLCDFIQKVRGIDYVNRIILECGRIPQGRLRFETDGSQKIKRIVFDRSGPTKLKSVRPPVKRFYSYQPRPSSRSELHSDNMNTACILCLANEATHEYDPCQHFPMCGECFARLDQKDLKTCMNCLQPATVRMRLPTTPVTQ